MATYNLVHSVKGGCGKTTFSIWLSYYLNEPQAESLLIDMDLLGTSMQVLIYGNDEVSSETAYTNDIFQSVKNNSRRFSRKIDWGTDKHLHIIFSSMDYREKDRFKAGKQSGYTPVVKHSMFRLGLRELIKHHKTIDGKVVSHFIFDMPPNSDGFSDAAMECIFNPKHSDLKDADRKNLFMMIGVDWGQTVATIGELKTLFLHEDENEPDRIFIVINRNLGDQFDADNYVRRKKEIEEAINDWQLSEETKNKIVFLQMRHSDYYTKLGIDGIGLRNAKAGEISDAFRAVIPAYAEYGKEFIDVTTENDGQNKLRKLISGDRNAKNE